jgi:hypothetical protein
MRLSVAEVFLKTMAGLGFEDTICGNGKAGAISLLHVLDRLRQEFDISVRVKGSRTKTGV